MFDHLKAIARRLLGRGASGWPPFLPSEPPPFLPGDPYAGVREPRWRGPGGRGASAAVQEPDDEPLVAAIGRKGRARN